MLLVRVGGRQEGLRGEWHTLVLEGLLGGGFDEEREAVGLLK